jgi:hypothetical protein
MMIKKYRCDTLIPKDDVDGQTCLEGFDFNVRVEHKEPERVPKPPEYKKSAFEVYDLSRECKKANYNFSRECYIANICARRSNAPSSIPKDPNFFREIVEHYLGKEVSSTTGSTDTEYIEIK